MDSKIKTKWVAALRSNKYKQTKHCLKNKSGYCCLGVLCDIVQPDKWKFIPKSIDVFFERYEHEGERLMPSPKILIICRLTHEAVDTLARMNDNDNSFEQIADWIKENL